MQGMLSLLDKDVRHDINQGGSENGFEAFRKFLDRMATNYQEEIHDIVIFARPDGKRAACEYKVTGTYLKVDPGLPSAYGQRYSIPGGAFFSIKNGKDAVLNDAATNTAWFFLLDLSHNRKFISGENPFKSMSREEARETLKKLREPAAKRPAPVSILRSKKPNLIFIVLESWSADLVVELGSEPGITPHFSALIKEGLLFTRFYADGNRSQQGIASIFSGFPALPVVTITENPGKSQTLPRFAATYGALGYQTDFFYGGQLEYGNIQAFLLNNGFKTITEDDCSRWWIITLRQDRGKHGSSGDIDDKTFGVG